jgi:molybdenum cofactor guanylyltransferase
MAKTSGDRSIAGIVLAGGLSRRMGGTDKALLPLQGEPLVKRVVERARPQVGAMALSAGGDPQRFASFGLPALADSIAGHVGPLAGILAGLDWASALPGVALLASFSCDAPFFPRDLVIRLRAARHRESAIIACAASAGRTHPVFALWPLDLREPLRDALMTEKARKVDAWTARYRMAEVTYPTEPIDPFFNINTPEQLAEAEAWLAKRKPGRERT